MRRAWQRPGVFPGEKGQEKRAQAAAAALGATCAARGARRSGKFGVRSTSGPGGHLWFALQPSPKPQVETGEDDKFRSGEGAGRRLRCAVMSVLCLQRFGSCPRPQGCA